MPNRLADATSPYLLQHADNPVDWFPWCQEAFAEARRRDVPVLLSVGYSSCHWCHVMAHESFEDPETAALMNARFVNVKVDREERPDVDRVYMDALQAMTGRGGWPMTVFLTPEGRPFYAGTYFPPEPRGGMPSFRQVLLAVAQAWDDRKEEVLGQADRLVAAIGSRLPAADPPAGDVLDRAIDELEASFDPRWGGFGRAPKFPQAPVLELLARATVLRPDLSARAGSMLRTTLEHLARGGIHDHLGGGFARYSVDGRWTVPHFEKMLYDNALLARVYLRAGQALGDPGLVAVARSTLDYLIDDLRDPSGGLHAAEDADSDGGEGRYYVWTWDELGEALGHDRDLVALLYGATREGNFEGANVLHLPEPLEVLAERAGTDVDGMAAVKASIDERLREHRSRRPRPGRDDKIVVAWNALALRALAEAGAVLGEDRYLEAAEDIAGVLVGPATAEDGSLLRALRAGRLGPPGVAEDHAAAAVGLYTLYEASGDERWFRAAERTLTVLLDRFTGPDGSLLASVAEDLVVHPVSILDGPTPSDHALTVEALTAHWALTGDGATRVRIERLVTDAGFPLDRRPSSAAHLAAAWATVLAGIHEVAVVAEDPTRRAELAAVVWERFRPQVFLAVGDGRSSVVPLLEGRPADGGLAYPCRGGVCDLPVRQPAELRRRLP